MQSSKQGNEKCVEKLNQMKKYLPFIDFMINKIKKKADTLPLESQLLKFQHLRSMISDRKEKHNWNMIVRVEDVIEQLVVKLNYKQQPHTVDEQSSECLNGETEENSVVVRGVSASNNNEVNVTSPNSNSSASAETSSEIANNSSAEEVGSMSSVEGFGNPPHNSGHEDVDDLEINRMLDSQLNMTWMLIPIQESNTTSNVPRIREAHLDKALDGHNARRHLNVGRNGGYSVSSRAGEEKTPRADSLPASKEKLGQSYQCRKQQLLSLPCKSSTEGNNRKQGSGTSRQGHNTYKNPSYRSRYPERATIYDGAELPHFLNGGKEKRSDLDRSKEHLVKTIKDPRVVRMLSPPDFQSRIRLSDRSSSDNSKSHRSATSSMGSKRDSSSKKLEHRSSSSTSESRGESLISNKSRRHSPSSGKSGDLSKNETRKRKPDDKKLEDRAKRRKIDVDNLNDSELERFVKENHRTLPHLSALKPLEIREAIHSLSIDSLEGAFTSTLEPTTDIELQDLDEFMNSMHIPPITLPSRVSERRRKSNLDTHSRSIEHETEEGDNVEKTNPTTQSTENVIASENNGCNPKITEDGNQLNKDDSTVNSSIRLNPIIQSQTRKGFLELPSPITEERDEGTSQVEPTCQPTCEPTWMSRPSEESNVNTEDHLEPSQDVTQSTSFTIRPPEPPVEVQNSPSVYGTWLGALSENALQEGNQTTGPKTMLAPQFSMGGYSQAYQDVPNPMGNINFNQAVVNSGFQPPSLFSPMLNKMPVNDGSISNPSHPSEAKSYAEYRRLKNEEMRKLHCMSSLPNTSSESNVGGSVGRLAADVNEPNRSETFRSPQYRAHGGNNFSQRIGTSYRTPRRYPNHGGPRPRYLVSVKERAMRNRRAYTEESISPLESLYEREPILQTGRGYGLQHFKIPKKGQSNSGGNENTRFYPENRGNNSRRRTEEDWYRPEDSTNTNKPDRNSTHTERESHDSSEQATNKNINGKDVNSEEGKTTNRNENDKGGKRMERKKGDIPKEAKKSNKDERKSASRETAANATGSERMEHSGGNFLCRETTANTMENVTGNLEFREVIENTRVNGNAERSDGNLPSHETTTNTRNRKINKNRNKVSMKVVKSNSLVATANATESSQMEHSDGNSCCRETPANSEKNDSDVDGISNSREETANTTESSQMEHSDGNSLCRETAPDTEKNDSDMDGISNSREETANTTESSQMEHSDGNSLCRETAPDTEKNDSDMDGISNSREETANTTESSQMEHSDGNSLCRETAPDTEENDNDKINNEEGGSGTSDNGNKENGSKDPVARLDFEHRNVEEDNRLRETRDAECNCRMDSPVLDQSKSMENNREDKTTSPVLPNEHIMKEWVEVFGNLLRHVGRSEKMVNVLEKISQLSEEKLQTIEKIINSEAKRTDESTSKEQNSPSTETRTETADKRTESNAESNNGENSGGLLASNEIGENESEQRDSPMENAKSSQTLKPKKKVTEAMSAPPLTRSQAQALSRFQQPANKTNQKQRKPAEQRKPANPEKPEGQVAGNLNPEQAQKTVPAPKKSELDKLHDDIRCMFMGHDVLAAMGPRLCRLLKSIPDIEEEKRKAEKSKKRPQKRGPVVKEYHKSVNWPRVVMHKIDLDNLGYGQKITDTCVTFKRQTGSNKAIRSEKTWKSQQNSSLINNEGVADNNSSQSSKRRYKKKKTSKKKSQAMDKTTKHPETGNRRVPEGLQSMGDSNSSPVGVSDGETENNGERVDDDSLLNYSLDRNEAVFKCKLCPLVTLNITAHYKKDHPDSEVLISRLSRTEASDALREAAENNGDNTSLEDVGDASLSIPRASSTYYCRMCSKAGMSSLYTFYVHMTEHTGEYRYRCPIKECKMTESNRRDIKYHVLHIHDSPRLKFSWNEIRIHSIPEESGRLYGFICSKCNFVQIFRENLEKHIASQHGGDTNIAIVKINLSAKNPLHAQNDAAENVNDSEPTGHEEQSRLSECESTPEKRKPPCDPRWGLMDGSESTCSSYSLYRSYDLDSNEEDEPSSPFLDTIIEVENCDSYLLKPEVESEEVSEGNLETNSQTNIEPDLPEIPLEVEPEPNFETEFIAEPESNIDTEFMESNAAPFEANSESNMEDTESVTVHLESGSESNMEAHFETNPEPNSERQQETHSEANSGRDLIVNSESESMDLDVYPDLRNFTMIRGSDIIDPLESSDSRDTEPGDTVVRNKESSINSVDSTSREYIIEKIRVGPLEAHLVHDNEIFYECYIKGCLFNTQGYATFEKHLKISHATTVWSGFCQVCQANVNELGRKRSQFVSNALVYALRHLKFHAKERVEKKLGEANNRSTPDVSINNVELNEAIESGDQEVEMSMLYPQKPLLRVRNLLGDRLSRPRDPLEITNEDESITREEPTGTHYIGPNTNESLMFTIQDVRSLNGGLDNRSDIQFKEIVSPVKNVRESTKAGTGQPVLVRSCPTRQIALRPETSALPIEVGHVQMIQSPVSSSSVVLNPLTDYTPVSSESIILGLPSSPVCIVPSESPPPTDSRFTLQPAPISTPPLRAPPQIAHPVTTPTTSSQAVVPRTVVMQAEPQASTSSSDPLTRAEPVVRTFMDSILIEIPSEFPTSEGTERCSGGEVDEGSTVSPSQPEEVAEEDSVLSMPAIQPFGNKTEKPPEIYEEMLTKEKLCQLFKCMASDCSVTCNLSTAFDQHIRAHELTKKSKKELLLRKGKKIYAWQQCSYCREIVNNPGSTLSQHILNAHGHCTYQCGHCFFRAVSLNYVTIHQNLAHKELVIKGSQIIYKCRRRKESPVLLDWMEMRKRKKCVRPYRCDQCGRQFLITVDFMNHLITEHHTVTAYTCHICKNLCFKADRLIAHYKLHSYFTYQCSYCIHGTEAEWEMVLHLCNFHFTQPAVVYVRAWEEGFNPQREENPRKLKTHDDLLKGLKTISYEEIINPDCRIEEEEPAAAEEEIHCESIDSQYFNAIVRQLGLTREGESDRSVPFIQELASLANISKDVSVTSLLPNARFSSESENGSETVLMSSGVSTSAGDNDRNIPVRETPLETINYQTQAVSEPVRLSRFDVNFDRMAQPGRLVVDEPENSQATTSTNNLVMESGSSTSDVTPALPPATHKLPPVVLTTRSGVKRAHSQSGATLTPRKTEEPIPSTSSSSSSSSFERSAVAEVSSDRRSDVVNPFQQESNINVESNLCLSSVPYMNVPGLIITRNISQTREGFEMSRDQNREEPTPSTSTRDVTDEPAPKKRKGRTPSQPVSESSEPGPSGEGGMKTNRSEESSTASAHMTRTRSLRNSKKKSDPEEKSSKSMPKKRFVKDLTGENLYKCGNRGCNISAPTEKELENHLLVCDDSRNFPLLECPHCSQLLKHNFSFLEHLRNHGVKKFSCGLCDFKTGIQRFAVRHLGVKHRCKQVKAVPGEPSEEGFLIFYPKNHIIDTNEEMNVEEKNVEEKNSEEGNPEEGNPEEGNPEEKNPEEENPEEENPEEKNSEEKNFEEKGYSPADEDKLPPQAIYATSVKCSECPYFTKVRSNMVRHMKFHVKAAEDEGIIVPTTAPTNPVPCLDAKEKMFDKMTNLAASSQMAQARERTIIDDLTPEEIAKLPQFVEENLRFKCCLPDCNYITVDERVLKHHIRALHPEVTFYSCPHCVSNVRADVRHVSLDRIGFHLKHHDSKLYKCAYCIYFHYQRSVVEKHTYDKHPDRWYFVHTVREPELRTIFKTEFKKESESGQPVWTCRVCNNFRSPIRAETLKHLLKVHQTKSTYKCQLCDLKSNHASFFRGHFLNKHHGEEVSYFRMVTKEFFSDSELSAVSESRDDHFDTTPLWQRSASRVRHIRGILIEEEEEVAVKAAKKKRAKKTVEHTESKPIRASTSRTTTMTTTTTTSTTTTTTTSSTTTTTTTSTTTTTTSTMTMTRARARARGQILAASMVSDQVTVSVPKPPPPLPSVSISSSSIPQPSVSISSPSIPPPSVPISSSSIPPPSVPISSSSIPPPSVSISSPSIPPPSVLISSSSIPQPSVSISSSSIPQPSVSISSPSIPPPSVLISSSSIPQPSVLISSSSIPQPSVSISSSSIPQPSVSISSPSIPQPSVSISSPSIPPPSVLISSSSIPQPSVSISSPSIPPPSVSISSPSIPPPSVSLSSSSIPPPSVLISSSSIPQPSVSISSPSIPPPSVLISSSSIPQPSVSISSPSIPPPSVSISSPSIPPPSVLISSPSIPPPSVSISSSPPPPPPPPPMPPVPVPSSTSFPPRIGAVSPVVRPLEPDQTSTSGPVLPSTSRPSTTLPVLYARIDAVTTHNRTEYVLTPIRFSNSASVTTSNATNLRPPLPNEVPTRAQFGTPNATNLRPPLPNGLSTRAQVGTPNATNLRPPLPNGLSTRAQVGTPNATNLRPPLPNGLSTTSSIPTPHITSVRFPRRYRVSATPSIPTPHITSVRFPRRYRFSTTTPVSTTTANSFRFSPPIRLPAPIAVSAPNVATVRFPPPIWVSNPAPVLAHNTNPVRVSGAVSALNATPVQVSASVSAPVATSIRVTASVSIPVRLLAPVLASTLTPNPTRTPPRSPASNPTRTPTRTPGRTSAVAFAQIPVVVPVRVPILASTSTLAQAQSQAQSESELQNQAQTQTEPTAENETSGSTLGNAELSTDRRNLEKRNARSRRVNEETPLVFNGEGEMALWVNNIIQQQRSEIERRNRLRERATAEWQKLFKMNKS